MLKTFFAVIAVAFVVSISFLFFSRNSEKLVQQNIGKILLGDSSLSQNLKPEELKILETVIPVDVRRSVAEGFGTCYLKYFDTQVALAGCAEGKPGNPISVYKISENNKGALLLGLGGDLNAWGGYYESKNIIITVFDTSITYFRPGFTEIKKVPGSDLEYQTENYVKWGGAKNEYEFSFDETTNILTVSVFKYQPLEGEYSAKLREVQFVLK